MMGGKSSRSAPRAEYRRQVFQVFNGDEWMCSYDAMYFMQPEARGPTRDDSSRDVIDDLVRDSDDPRRTDARDMAVWRDGRILAVVRRGRDGRPVVADFTADEAVDTREEGQR